MACACPYVPEVAICASMAWTAQKVARATCSLQRGCEGNFLCLVFEITETTLKRKYQVYVENWLALFAHIYLTTGMEVTLCPMTLDIRRLNVTKVRLFS